MVGQAQHHKYSASGSAATILCPGKAAMEEGYPSTSNRAADEGSAAHYLAAQCLLNGKLPLFYLGKTILCWEQDGERDGQCFSDEVVPEGAVKRSQFHVNNDMVDNTTLYVNFCNMEAKHATLLVEQRVHFGPLMDRDYGDEEVEFGTADAIIVADSGLWIHIVDLKYGRNLVEAENNSQLVEYAVGAINDFDSLFDFSALEFIRLTIHQPRVDGPDTWIISRDELFQHHEVFKQAVIRSEEARAFFKTPNLQFEDIQEWSKEYLNPTEKGCQWCLRKGDCPALVEECVDALTLYGDVQMPDLDAPAPATGLAVVNSGSFAEGLETAISMIPTLDHATIAKLYGARKLIGKMIESVETAMFNSMMSGNSDSEFKLVKGRDGNRKWKDESEAENRIKGMRFKVDEMYDWKLKSPTKMDEIVRNRPKVRDKIAALVVREEGGITIVPMKDKRPEYKPEILELPDLTKEGETAIENFDDIL